MQKLAGKTTITVSRMQLCDKLKPVHFVVTNRIGSEVASATVAFHISDTGIEAKLQNTKRDPQYNDIDSVFGNMLLSIRHWCQSNDISGITVTCKPEEEAPYHNYGFTTSPSHTYLPVVAA